MLRIIFCSFFFLKELLKKANRKLTLPEVMLRARIDRQFKLKDPGFTGVVLTPWKKSSVLFCRFVRDFYQWESGLSLEFVLGKFRNLRRNSLHLINPLHIPTQPTSH